MVITKDGLFIDCIIGNRYFRYDLLKISTIFRINVREAIKTDEETRTEFKITEAIFSHDPSPAIKPTVILTRSDKNNKEKENELKEFASMIEKKCLLNYGR